MHALFVFKMKKINFSKLDIDLVINTQYQLLFNKYYLIC